MPVGSIDVYEGAMASLKRIQKFDVKQLPRVDDLGKSFNFTDVVEPAQNIVDLFNRLSLSALEDFPDPNLNTIKQQADSIYNIFESILEFNADQQDPGAARSGLISQVTNAYPGVFANLHPFISYSLHRSADFQRLDSDARAILQSIKDEAGSISEGLSQYEADAKNALEEIRRVAAEEGVTKQAVHFSKEYEHHTDEASKWQDRVKWWSIGLAVYAFLSLFLHKLPWLSPENTYDAVQLSISKFLFFSVIAYMLFLSGIM